MQYELWSPMKKPNYSEDITDFVEIKEKSKDKKKVTIVIIAAHEYILLSIFLLIIKLLKKN